MIWCSAPFCNNSTAKGYICKIFPKNLERRAQWVANMNVKNWIPTDRSYLCEVHFSPEMWERRSDKKPKLKPNAVPTIFGYWLTEKTAFRQTEDELPLTNSTQNEQNFAELVLNEEQNVTDQEHQTAAKQEREKKLEKALDIQTKRLLRIQRQSKALKDMVRRLKYVISQDKYRTALKMVFNEDQIKALCNKRRTVKNWSNKTVERALQLKFICGTSGYEELLRQNMPFPSMRTLRRKLENLKFESGISKEMLDFLKLKVPNLENNTDRECGLVVDEMSITPGHVFDPSTNKRLGDVTFPHTEGKATHALVLMLTGTACRWKHVVGYYFTGNSFDSETLKEIMFQIIHMSEAIGLRVNSITSDMGSGNMGVWKSCGISTGRYSKVTSRIVHPCDPNRFLYFIADVPHLLKNLKQSLLSNKFFTIPEEFVIKYNLPSDKVKIEHFDELIRLQEGLEFLLTPKLDIRNNNTFNKMRVDKAKNMFCPNISTSFLLVADENQKPEYITTAWFVKNISKWFSYMTSRNCKIALGKKNEEIYNEKISFLREMIDLFTTMTIGKNEHFKPVQRGMIISTTSVINLVDYLINNREFKFVLTGRFTQDCLENLFSQLRQKNVIPNCLQFKNDLKIVAMVMYLKSISKSNYDQDDSEFFSGFLDYLNDKSKMTTKTNSVELSQSASAASIIDHIPPFDYDNIIEYNNIEMNCLYNLAGYCLKAVQRSTITCCKCIQSAGSKVPVQFKFSKLVRLKCYNTNTLHFVNEETFWVFLKLENIYRHYQRYFSKMRDVNLLKFLFDKFCSVPADHILNCHNLRQKLFKRFATIRLKLKKKHRASSLRFYNSKSMAMHYSFM